MPIIVSKRDQIFEGMFELDKQQTDRLLVQIFAEFEVAEHLNVPFAADRFYKIVEENIKGELI